MGEGRGHPLEQCLCCAGYPRARRDGTRCRAFEGRGRGGVRLASSTAAGRPCRGSPLAGMCPSLEAWYRLERRARSWRRFADEPFLSPCRLTPRPGTRGGPSRRPMGARLIGVPRRECLAGRRSGSRPASADMAVSRREQVAAGSRLGRGDLIRIEPEPEIHRRERQQGRDALGGDLRRKGEREAGSRGRDRRARPVTGGEGAGTRASPGGSIGIGGGTGAATGGEAGATGTGTPGGETWTGGRGHEPAPVPERA